MTVPSCTFPRCQCAGSCHLSDGPRPLGAPIPAKAIKPSVPTYCAWPQCPCANTCAYAQHRAVPVPPPRVRAAPSMRDMTQWYGRPCPYCDKPMEPRRTIAGRMAMPTRDHIEPRVLGGSGAAFNTVVACCQCNNDKDCMTLEQWYFHLKQSNDCRYLTVGRFIADYKQADSGVPMPAGGVEGGAAGAET